MSKPIPDNDFRKNSSGYSDPTAYLGTKPILRAENEQSKRVTDLIGVLKYIIDAADRDKRQKNRTRIQVGDRDGRQPENCLA